MEAEIVGEGMRLPPGWYVLAEESELSRTRPSALRRFGLDLVVWHSGRDWVAQVDRCPHRSARLSLGSVKQGEIVCPFHGIRFDGEGACRHVPELGASSSTLCLRSWRLEAREGFLWIPWRNPAEKPKWFEALPRHFAGLRAEWRAPFFRCVENQLDFAHLPFVHASTIGRGADPARKVRWEIGEQGIKAFTSADRLPDAFFEFRFPNLWRLHISARAQEMLAFVPVDEGRTILYLRHYQGFVSWPLLGAIVAKAAMPFNRIVLAQDRRVVLSQVPHEPDPFRGEQLLPSDKGILAFRRWLAQNHGSI